MRTRRIAALLPATLLVAALPVTAPADGESGRRALPWREAGLDERQAAAHLLNRCSYGPRPGEIEEVVEAGLESWLDSQLSSKLPDPELEARVRGFRALGLSARETAETYLGRGQILRQARRDGAIPAEMENADDLGMNERRVLRQKILAYAREKDFRSQRELGAELFSWKLYRALYSRNQLREVLADFWFNHFNVSLTDNETRPYILSYDRDAIRPNVTGSFRHLLGATARHPAMLLYLDNARSTAGEGAVTTFELHRRRYQASRGGRGDRARRGPEARRRPGGAEAQRRRPRGLNENYARELLELHTLGVAGGYDQDDVVEVARALTGWAVLPPGEAGQAARRGLDRAQRFGGAGFVSDGAFIFRSDAHDAGKKRVLDRTLAAGRGLEDGEEVLDLVAAHPSTARHLARKLAVRFVADDPPEPLVDRLAETFLATSGDLGAVVRDLVYSPEFWSAEARGAKIRSPFELAVSALRGLDAEVTQPRELLDWVSRMGQPLYAYQAPTGFPDQAEFWVNSGSLLNRMNFGLELAAGDIAGVHLDLAALNGHREPESYRDALETYAGLLLPGRAVTETVRLLEPLARDPSVGRRIDERATAPEAPPGSTGFDDPADSLDLLGGENEDPPKRAAAAAPVPEAAEHPLTLRALEQVVGLILGSPEFQRR